MARIISFQPEHIEAALRLWRQTDHIGLNPVDDQPQRLAAFLKRNPGCSFVAASEDDSEVVGACLCGHDMRRAAIYHLAVAQPYRRTGLGGNLLNASLQALVELGITKCHASVFRANPYASRFWAPQGWQRRDELFMYSRSLPSSSGTR